MIRNARRVVEERHQPVACKVLDGALLSRDELAHGQVVLAQHTEDLLRLGRLCESRESAKVAEERSDLPPMTRQKLFSFIAREQVRGLRREARELRSLPLHSLE